MDPYPDLDIAESLDQGPDGFKIPLEEQMIELQTRKSLRKL